MHLILLKFGGNRIKQRKTYHILTGIILLLFISLLIVQYTNPDYKTLKDGLCIIGIVLAIYQVILNRKNKQK